MVVRVIVMGVIGMSCGGCHFQILPCNPSRDLPDPVALVIIDDAYCAEANEFAGFALNCFFAVSTQATNS